MRRLTLAIFLPLLLSAADLRQAPPDDIGLSDERLARITTRMQSDVDEGLLPGAIGLLARRGQVGYFESVGQADRENTRPMADDAIFRIYSMSKPITSVALMMLHEEGKFRLTDPVARYIPELADLKVAEENIFYGSDPEHINRVGARRQPTIQDLMRHTSGLAYGFNGDTAVDRLYKQVKVIDYDSPLTTMIDRLAKLPLLYHPGEKFHYSIAVDVQGRLVEILSGMRFDRYLQEKIFEPLGMVDTGFSVPAEKHERFAQIYGLEDGKLSGSEPAQSKRYLSPPAWHSGGGGLVSTAMDYLRFCQMLLNNGELDGERLLGRKTVELMTRDHLAPADPARAATTGYGFGLNFAVHLDPAVSGSAASVGEYNWGGAAGTKFWIDPSEEFIGVYMIQIRPGGGDFGKTFKELAYQAIVD